MLTDVGRPETLAPFLPQDECQRLASSGLLAALAVVTRVFLAREW